MAWKVWAVVGGCLLTSSQIRKSELGGGGYPRGAPLALYFPLCIQSRPQPIGRSKVGPAPQSILSGNTPKDVHTQRYASLINT